MLDYDFIIAGGGVSGLSLAYHLAHSPLNARSILIVEQDSRNKKDHALSFWSNHSTPFDRVILRSWDQLQIRCEDLEMSIDLGGYRYHTLRSADYTRFIAQDLEGCTNVEFLEGTIDQIEDGEACARVKVNGHLVTGQWAFDSRFQLAEFSPDPTRYCSLRQHFVGWEIETSQAVFNPKTATLFDWRVPQQHELRFFYVLPYSERHALVEYVLLSPDHWEETLRGYIENTLGIRDYRILAKEGGVTLLSDYPFPRPAGRRVMAIGIPGGRVKPSAGYAFMRIQRDSAAIVSSLLKTGRPFDIPADRGFYRFCDAALLQIMQQHGDDVKPIYKALFKNNPIERVLHFLDETASPGEALALMLSLPLHLLWEALFQAACLDLGILRRPA
jgi:lycopene beta-cyclase